jgi:release factor glutamine methyltransferase
MNYPNNPEAVKAHQAAFLTGLKKRTDYTSYTIERVEVLVGPRVFPPATDTKLLAAHTKIKPGDRFFEATTGSGIITVIAGLQGGEGVAVDINPDAVANANDNFHKHGLKVEAIESDLFDQVPAQKFDHIFANGPYFEGDLTEPLEASFYGAYRFVERLFSVAPRYLAPQGRILLTFAEWGELEHAEQSMTKNGFQFEVIDKRNSDDGQRTYRLYEAVLR